jgi:hypothetical protein
MGMHPLMIWSGRYPARWRTRRADVGIKQPRARFQAGTNLPLSATATSAPHSHADKPKPTKQSHQCEKSPFRLAKDAIELKIFSSPRRPAPALPVNPTGESKTEVIELLHVRTSVPRILCTQGRLPR